MTEDRAAIGSTPSGSFVANVLPGTYEIHYEAKSSGQNMPVNEDAFLGMMEVGSNPDARQEFAIDIPVAELSGAITIDGAEPSNSVSERGRILFVDPRTGEEIAVGATSEGSYETRLVLGEYEVFYEHISGGALVPINRRGYIQKLTVDSNDTRDIEMRTGRLDGEILVGTALPPADASDDGVVILRNEHGDEVVLGNTAQQGFSVLVLNGTYTVYYAAADSRRGAPRQHQRATGGRVVDGDAAPTINIPVATISGSLALSGETPPDSAYDDGGSTSATGPPVTRPCWATRGRLVHGAGRARHV